MSDATERMQETARAVATILPPGTGFIVLAFDLDHSGGQMEYVANAKREGVCLALREFLVHAEKGFGTHTKGVGTCPTCGQEFGTNPPQQL